MNRNQRREAKENKRAGHAGIAGRIASGNHLSASNDEPEPPLSEAAARLLDPSSYIGGTPLRLSEADRKLARAFAGPDDGTLDLVVPAGSSPRSERFHREDLTRAIDQRRGQL